MPSPEKNLTVEVLNANLEIAADVAELVDALDLGSSVL